jgi:hypothetical protein
MKYVTLKWTRSESAEGETVRNIWNEEIRRCGVADNAEKEREAKMRWHRWVIKRLKDNLSEAL